MNRYNFRRRVYGTRTRVGVLNSTLRNIANLGIDDSIINTKIKKHSLTSDDLDHYEPFLEEEANQRLRSNQFKSEEEVKRYLQLNPELKNIVETLVDSCIVYNDDNEFCELFLNKKKFDYSAKFEASVTEKYSEIMKGLGFNNEQEAWKVFYSLFLSGKVGYEVIYETILKSDFDEKLAEIKDIINLSESQLKVIKTELKSDLSESKKKDINSRAKNIIRSLDELKSVKLMYDRRLDMAAKIATLKEDEIGNLNESLLKEIEDQELAELGLLGDDKEEERKNLVPKVSIKTKDKIEKIPIKIIGFKRLNPYTFTRIDGIKEDGSRIVMYKVLDHYGKYSYLPEQCIVTAEWNNISGNSEMYESTYLDSIKRNYNLTRSLEESRVGWNILVAQYRLKMIVPTGTKIGVKAKESVTKLVSQYKEKLSIDSSTGVVSINGETDYKFGRNIALPSRNGNTTQIDSIQYNGVDLGKMDVVDYFRDSVYRDSTIPKSRFDSENRIGSLSLFKADGIPYDEVMYHKRCRRICAEFSKLIKKPIYYSAIIEDPVLSLDNDFENSINIKFNTDGYFEMAKEHELTEAKMKNYSSFERVQDSEREPLFDKKFLLVDKLKILTEEEWELNEKRKSEKITQENDGQVDTSRLDKY